MSEGSLSLSAVPREPPSPSIRAPATAFFGGVYFSKVRLGAGVAAACAGFADSAGVCAKAGAQVSETANRRGSVFMGWGLGWRAGRYGQSLGWPSPSAIRGRPAALQIVHRVAPESPHR